MLRDFKGFEKSKILVVWGQVYLGNRCVSLNCTVKLIKDKSAQSLDYLMDSLDSSI